MEPPRKPQGITPHAHFLQDACDTMRANRILPGVGYRVKESPQGTTLEIIRQGRQQWFHPFKIYRVADKKYQVRGGYVGFRSAFFAPFNSPSITGLVPFGGNGETVLQVINGSDVVVDFISEHDYWTAKTTASTLYTVEEIAVGNTGDFGVSVDGDGATFTLNSDVDGDGCVKAGFWIEITDTDSPNPSAEIKCRMWATTAGATGRASKPWPYPYGDHTSSPGIGGFTVPETIVIPIGVVVPRDSTTPNNSDLKEGQFAVDHQIRHHRPGVINADSLGGTFGPAYWRGVWDIGDTENLSGTYFYDGEEISVTETVDGNDVTTLWVHVGIDLENSRPTISGGPGNNWRLKAGPGQI